MPLLVRAMAPKFALFTKGSKLPLNKGLSYYSLALNPRCVVTVIMAPKFALFTKGSKLPLNKGLSNYSLVLNP